MSQFDEVTPKSPLDDAIKKAWAKIEPYKNDHREVVRSENVPDALPILSLPRFTFDGYINRLGGMAFKDIYKLPDTPESKTYQRVIGDSVKVLSKQHWDLENLTNSEHSWVVGLTDSENRNPILSGDYVVNASSKVEGEPAMLRVMGRIGAGISKSICLEASGFYVNIIPSKSPALAAMMMEMLAKGEEIGYRTGGIGYDLGSTFTEQEIMAHIFDNIRGSTLEGVSIDDVRNHIKIPDYRRLIIGQLWATYQTGIIYDQPCIANHNTCQHVQSSKLNLGSVLRVNESRFTEEQYQHLVRSRKGVTLQDVTRYQGLNIHNDLVYRIKGDEDDANQINITLSVPNIVDAHSTYTSTIDYITATLPRALSEHGTVKSRNQFLSDQLKSVPILSNLAWITKITVGKEGVSEVESFTNIETIRDLITKITDDDDFNEIGDAFVEAFADFMLRNDNTMVLIRNEPCPVCGEQVKDLDGEAVDYIPLEAESLFLAITQFRLIANKRLRQYVI